MEPIKVGYDERFVKRCLKQFETVSTEEIKAQLDFLIMLIKSGRADLDTVKDMNKLKAVLIGRGIEE